jgi:quercetin dioxygenase-like cupin family protein
MELQVVELRLAAGETIALQPAPRVVYDVDANAAEYSTGAHSVSGPLHVLRFELVPTMSPAAMLSAPVEFRAGEPRLVRCDRVDFPPGGVAYLHTHGGPGIRVLLHGTIRIEVGGRSDQHGPLQAWFEPGPEPVFAAASETEPTAFVRCMVLPVGLRGQSSIRYVREEDATKPKSPSYTVFLDEPLDEALGAP